MAVVGLVAVFAAGVLVRPAGDAQVPWLDLGVYDGVFVLAAGIAAARGARPGRDAPRVAGARGRPSPWSRSATSGSRSSTSTPIPRRPSPVSDAFYLVGYVGSYVAVILLLRARVPRFLASMWLDGLVTGLGTAAALTGILIPRVTDALPAGKAVSTAGYLVGDVLLSPCSWPASPCSARAWTGCSSRSAPGSSSSRSPT